MESRKRTILESITFGKRVAEEERDSLAHYFVETDQWRRIFAGEIDVVYGPKGSGKSALHSALMARQSLLFDRGVIVFAAENPRGAPAFKELVDDPPASEREFIGLWKTYFLSVAGSVLKDYGAVGPAATQVITLLAGAGLLQAKPEKNLLALLKAARQYAKTKWDGLSIQPEVKFDPHTGNVTGASAKITLGDGKAENTPEAALDLDDILKKTDLAFKEMGFHLWILLDRLDVAFAESHVLEENALRALFKFYLDCQAFDNLRLKVFLRSDIWKRIAASGFREASHITATVTIEWDERSLLNLLVRRALQNRSVTDYYAVEAENILQSYEAQETFFYRMFPDKIEPADRKPTTFAWIIGRTRDGTQATAPRELIHLLTRAREVQLGQLDVGQAEPDGERLFTNTSIRDALAEVSKTRLEQTLYAEYPVLRDRLEKLRREKTRQTPASLAKIWAVPPPDAEALAGELVGVGFFERQGAKEVPEYWVPHLYRQGLEMIQGRADASE